MKRAMRKSDECDSCNRAVDLPAYRAEVKRLRKALREIGAFASQRSDSINAVRWGVQTLAERALKPRKAKRHG